MDLQNEQIPPGFSTESWNALTPEQKKQYLNATAQTGAQGNGQAPATPTQGQIYAEVGKQMLLGTIWSFFRSLLYRFLRF
ncbi:hypothetical protein LEP1GSC058_1161 [Leptospira fainei serovar Hurstbridge str. BUT 6]|uniref:Uncharacterized protein n=1 Tax=Leptospira fainei serovar Hurstbridge str. BUT 6 TaxID=1193011 RepID=S3UVY3_9LEPT|nr:hypothetical protein [Leptospira fainei]EPG72499.1 hypothetical protein LEP1GSC058_1161 [Leptospira fainei serovar Hurstbridge str. BUT 6]